MMKTTCLLFTMSIATSFAFGQPTQLGMTAYERVIAHKNSASMRINAQKRIDGIKESLARLESERKGKLIENSDLSSKQAEVTKKLQNATEARDQLQNPRLQNTSTQLVADLQIENWQIKQKIETNNQLLSIIDKNIIELYSEKANLEYDLTSKDLTPSDNNNLPTSNSPTNQSIIIDGTAKFLAERFKEEVTSVYLEKFRSRLTASNLKLLFPRTEKCLGTLDIFDTKSMGIELKQAFEEDLDNSIANIRRLMENSPGFENLEAQSLYTSLVFSIDLFEKLNTNYHPIEILAFLDARLENIISLNQKKYDSLKKNIQDTLKIKTQANVLAMYRTYRALVKLVNLIQLNLQKRYAAIDANHERVRRIWLQFTDLHKLDSKQDILEFLKELQKMYPSEFSELSLNEGLAEDFFYTTIIPTLETLNNIENIQIDESPINSQSYTRLMQNFVQMIEVANKYLMEHRKMCIPEDQMNTIKSILRAYQSIYNKDYATLLPEALSILENSLRQLKQDTAALESCNYFRRYGAFMAAISQAKSSDEIKGAIKDNVTSFTALDKRYGLQSISLTAHPGLSLGRERLNVNGSWKTNIGITAPIGLEFAFGSKRKTGLNSTDRNKVVRNKNIYSMKGGYYGLFLSVVDIGAAFNYRLNDPEAQLPEEFSFKQIFSPGFSINHGLKNSPITLGLGVQYTPKLREVNTSNGLETSSSFKVLFRVSWDMPIICFFRKD